MAIKSVVIDADVSTANGKDPWGYMNVAVERCNNIIEGIEQYADTAEDAQMRYYLGEAYFLRSFVYFDMVKTWGDVPARNLAQFFSSSQSFLAGTAEHY